MLKPNDRIGPYQLTRRLGEGGFGVVWMAEDKDAIAAPPVAIKIAHPGKFEPDCFVRESKIWMQATGNPNVLPLIKATILDGHYVMVSEFVEEGSLRQWLRHQQNVAPTIGMALEMTLGILDGLAYLHGKGIIHRDLKPENILVQGQKPRLTDFGISRLASVDHRTTVPEGTLGYVAPEVFDGVMNEGTDVWAVGVVLYQLLCGSRPFPPMDFEKWKYPPPVPDFLPADLVQIICCALAYHPEHRYQTAPEMKDAIKLFIQGNFEALRFKPVPPTFNLEDAPPTLQDSSIDIEVQETGELVSHQPRPLMVSFRGSKDFRSIAEAVRNAEPGSTILVSPGVYRESITIDKPLELVGVGPIEEIRIFGKDEPCLSISASNVKIRGLWLCSFPTLKHTTTISIRSGNCTIEHCEITSDSVSCITVSGKDSAPHIRMCKIHHSRGSSGIFVLNEAQPVIEDCEIYKNHLSGIAITNRANPVIRRCRVFDNLWKGISLWDFGTGIVMDSELTGNQGIGQITVSGESSVSVERCTIETGSRFGVYVYDFASINLTQCMVTDHQASGIFGQNATLRAKDCNVASNVKFGVEADTGADIRLTNCQIEGNSNGDISIVATAKLVFDGMEYQPKSGT